MKIREKLVTLANKFDKQGLHKQADLVDNIVTKLASKLQNGMPSRVKKLIDKELNPKKFKSVSQNSKVMHAEWWEQVLYAANELMNGHGIESLEVGPNHNPARTAMYVNMGETYEATLIYDEDRKEFTWESWGDWQERVEEEEEMHVDQETGEWVSDETDDSGQYLDGREDSDEE